MLDTITKGSPGENVVRTLLPSFALRAGSLRMKGCCEVFRLASYYHRESCQSHTVSVPLLCGTTIATRAFRGAELLRTQSRFACAQ